MSGSRGSPRSSPTSAPGTRWRYEASFAILGVLLERATQTPLDELVYEQVCRPLRMDATAFVSAHLPAAEFDEGGDASRWAQRPVFHDACGGLVSTAQDYLRFAAAVFDDDRGIATDRLGDTPRDDPFLDGGTWGYGVAIHDGYYGWAGGLGTLWWSWPRHAHGRGAAHAADPTARADVRCVHSCTDRLTRRYNRGHGLSRLRVDERGVRGLRGREGLRPHARAALRHGRLRGRPLLRDARRARRCSATRRTSTACSSRRGCTSWTSRTRGRRSSPSPTS